MRSRRWECSRSTRRGLNVRENTFAALATLCAILGIAASTIRIHREDPLTTHACPEPCWQPIIGGKKLELKDLIKHAGAKIDNITP